MERILHHEVIDITRAYSVYNRHRALPFRFEVDLLKTGCEQQSVEFSMIMTNKLFTKTIVKADAHLQIQVRANYTVVIDHTPERSVFDYGRLEITRNWGKNQ
jgi:hypothetical protein